MDGVEERRGQNMALIDTEGSCYSCRGSRVQYSCTTSQFTERCLNPACKAVYRVDVAYEVHKKITTVEGFRHWLTII